MLYKIVDIEVNIFYSLRKTHLSFVQAFNVEFCITLVRIGLFLKLVTMLSQCIRDFEAYNDSLFLCPCLALGFPHCISSQRGSFLFSFPLYIILILNWFFDSGSQSMACTSFLVPSYLMLLQACIRVPSLGLKVFFFFTPLPRCSWFPQLGFPTLCIQAFVPWGKWAWY